MSIHNKPLLFHTSHGQILSIEITPEITAGEVKNILCSQANEYQINDSDLIYNDQPLQDNQKISELDPDAKQRIFILNNKGIVLQKFIFKNLIFGTYSLQLDPKTSTKVVKDHFIEAHPELSPESVVFKYDKKNIICEDSKALEEYGTDTIKVTAKKVLQSRNQSKASAPSKAAGPPKAVGPPKAAGPPKTTVPPQPVGPPNVITTPQPENPPKQEPPKPANETPSVYPTIPQQPFQPPKPTTPQFPESITPPNVPTNQPIQPPSIFSEPKTPPPEQFFAPPQRPEITPPPLEQHLTPNPPASQQATNQFQHQEASQHNQPKKKVVLEVEPMQREPIDAPTPLPDHNFNNFTPSERQLESICTCLTDHPEILTEFYKWLKQINPKDARILKKNQKVINRLLHINKKEQEQQQNDSSMSPVDKESIAPPPVKPPRIYEEKCKLLLGYFNDDKKAQKAFNNLHKKYNTIDPDALFSVFVACDRDENEVIKQFEQK